MSMYATCLKARELSSLADLHVREQARTNFDSYFGNCKNHVRGVISSYENLLETIDFRKRQKKLTKQFSRFEKLNAARESGEHATRKKRYLDGEDEEEDGYGINHKDALADEDDDAVEDGFSIFGFGTHHTLLHLCNNH